MPGFNQRGPMNEGAMTGRKRGTCPGATMDTNSTNVRGSGRGMGRRKCQATGRGMGYGRWTTLAPAPGSVNQDTLQNRVNLLEAELSAIKNQLRTRSEQTKQFNQ
ncbi:MAG: DUF5320 domain-containing protein [Proteobacteria bacterium]|nr:hypothetical protein [Desulfobacula sp.]MBU3954007.1 DUF5320 domain-containing protein [Pseudomonadota bacterium]MBU4131012.1 DUF5320 domain-containing protein [Pseudomonadota bacterium]